MAIIVMINMIDDINLLWQGVCVCVCVSMSALSFSAGFEFPCNANVIYRPYHWRHVESPLSAFSICMSTNLIVPNFDNPFRQTTDCAIGYVIGQMHIFQCWIFISANCVVKFSQLRQFYNAQICHKNRCRVSTRKHKIARCVCALRAAESNRKCHKMWNAMCFRLQLQSHTAIQS